VCSSTDDGHSAWQFVSGDVDLWQAEALCLPVSMVRGRAITWFNQLAHHLNDFNEATTHDEVVEAFTKVLMASVASGIYSLGASQRSSAGFRIVTRGTARAN
jgi:hypothetical protein